MDLFNNDPLSGKQIPKDVYDGKEANKFLLDEVGQWETPHNNNHVFNLAELTKRIVYLETEDGRNSQKEYILHFLDSVTRERPELLEEFFKGRKVFEAIIPNFTNSIAVNNKTRVKPYREGYKTPKVPKKYLTPEYGYKVGKLVLLATGEVIPSNASKAGFAKIWTCNGQEIYNGKIHEHSRANYMEKMKAYITPYIEETPFIHEQNLTLEVRFYLLDNKLKKDNTKNIDNINLWIWSKVIGDVMKKLILPDDDPYIIPEDRFKTIFVDKEEETRLEIILWAKDNGKETNGE